MGDKRYIISDAAKLIEVESHVLRYWEEELSIEVPRNEMGHRYYTDFYIELFKKVKELKEGGFQLKAIRLLIPELMALENGSADGVEVLREELFNRFTENQQPDISHDKQNEYIINRECSYSVDDEKHNNNNENYYNDGKRNNGERQNGEESVSTVLEPSCSGEISAGINNDLSVKNSKLEQFQTIITEVVSNALKENTGMLGREVSDIVSDNVIKEMDYLMHVREKQEEERFKKLDETIRSYQVSNREKSKIKKGIFSKIKRL